MNKVILKEIESLIFRSNKFKAVYRTGNSTLIKEFLKDNLPYYTKKAIKNYKKTKEFFLSQTENSAFLKNVTESILKALRESK
ncbi:MAG: hypothetical protein LBC44_01700 [Mycoplasmataceae bacterium]|jgi:hypothetical protein|nr:hypothetical protein [Mycoplasmataceae bacterium]